jgi:uncharacterized membrane protein
MNRSKLRIYASVAVGVAALLLVLGAMALPARGETFVPTTIHYPGSTSTAARGINDRGDVVGSYSCAAACVNPVSGETSTAGTHGFLLQDGAYTRIDVPGGTTTLARRISTQSVVVGHYNVGAVTHGFAYFDGMYVYPIDVPPEFFDHPASPLRNTLVVGISPEGDLVGCFHEDSQTMTTMHGWLLHNGKFTVLTTPHSEDDNASHDPDTMNNDVAPNGRITGFYGSAGVSYVADKQNRIVTTFTFENNPSFFTLAQDINARGDVVGQYFDAQGHGHGFLRTQDAEYRSLEVEGAVSTSVFGVNAKREIVGQYAGATGAQGFVYRLNPDDGEQNDAGQRD